jgi:hypothetical protein
MGNLCLSILPIGNVLEGSNPATTLHGLFHHAQDASRSGLHNLGAPFSCTDIRHYLREEPLGVTDELTRSFSQSEQIEKALSLQRSR